MQVSVFVVVSLQLLVCHELQSSVRRPEQAGNKPLGTEKSRFSHGEIKAKQNSDLLIFNTPNELGKLFFYCVRRGFFFPPLERERHLVVSDGSSAQAYSRKFWRST